MPIHFIVRFSLVALVGTLFSLNNAVGAELIAGKTCPSKGAVMTLVNKKYTCIQSGKKLVWDKGKIVRTPVAIPSSSPKPVGSISPSPTASPSKNIEPIRNYDLVPTVSMTTYSEQLRRYKDRPDGYLYIHQTQGVVQVLIPALPNMDPASEYFVVVGGGTVGNRECKSGDLRLPLDLRAERDRKSILYTALPRGPKGLPVGIVFKVSNFPISFTCYYANETTYSVSVLETDNLSSKVKSQSRPFEFVTPILWKNLLQPINQSTQTNTFAITPNAICLPEGSSVKGTDGKDYFCKKSMVDGLLRWAP